MDDYTFSAVMRQLRDETPELVMPFLKSFKAAMDEAVRNELEDPDTVALTEALKKIKLAESLEPLIKVAANVIEMGAPEEAGRGIADIVKFLLQRVESGKRAKTVAKLKDKIWKLNEQDISSKKTPSSASMGQSITFIKTILNGHSPDYIRQVLTSIVTNLT